MWNDNAKVFDSEKQQSYRHSREKVVVVSHQKTNHNKNPECELSRSCGGWLAEGVSVGVVALPSDGFRDSQTESNNLKITFESVLVNNRLAFHAVLLVLYCYEVTIFMSSLKISLAESTTKGAWRR